MGLSWVGGIAKNLLFLTVTGVGGWFWIILQQQFIHNGSQKWKKWHGN